MSPPHTDDIQTEVKESMPAAPPAAAAAVVGAPSVTSIAASQVWGRGVWGGANKCATCTKTVYAMEQLTYDGKMFHKNCLKCAHCNCVINLKNVASLEGEYYCKPHFKQLFKLKGNYAEGFGKEDHKKQWSQSSQSSQA
ncbi:hypothetical protein BC829DRAFT_383938 [Chytridium lagenaria]|nr:hypothetical protein BC829DRAFT_383938 [Chytridium lagenaria]